jgi:predicted HTH domain antitoxin
LRQTIALELFREGLVSIGKASEIAGLTRGKMMDLLASKKIPINYVPSDLREDVQALQRL